MVVRKWHLKEEKPEAVNQWELQTHSVLLMKYSKKAKMLLIIKM